MGNDFDGKFLQRFVVIEKNLLALDSSSIDDFNHQWTTLVHDLRVAMDSESLNSTTVRVAHSLANRVSLVIQSFLDLEILAEKLMSSLLDESSPALNRTPTPPSETSNPSVPSYIKPSYDWLVENVHNPYPSPEVRDVIARKSGAARKDVDNWFMDARKRIGWNDTRKTYFANKRADMIDAATRFYSNDERLSLSQGAEHALISLMKNAKDLYSDKFNKTVLATRLDAAVKDLTPRTKAEAKAEQQRQLQLRKARDSYPSPERSPPHSSPALCNDEVDNSASQSMTSRKRRDLTIDPVDIGKNEDPRPAKRSRLDASASSESVVPSTGLPSPATSIDEPLQSFEASRSSSSSSLVPTKSSRKRPLSETDGIIAPKRLCHFPSAFRMQNVSDPLPLSNDLLFDETSFDGWFQQFIDRSDVGQISPSGVSVELCNLSDFDFETPTDSRIVSPVISEQALGNPIVEVADTPNFLLDVPWNRFDLDIFAPSDAMPHSNSLINFAEQVPLRTPLAQDISNIHNQELRSSDDFSTFFGLSNPDVVDCDVIPPNSVSNESWDFSTSVITEGEKHSVDLQGSNGLLTSFDFSDTTDFLPSPNTIFPPTLTQVKIRQEKEKEFREACEKAQRLALELEKGDLFPL